MKKNKLLKDNKRLVQYHGQPNWQLNDLSRSTFIYFLNFTVFTDTVIATGGGKVFLKSENISYLVLLKVILEPPPTIQDFVIIGFWCSTKWNEKLFYFQVLDARL